LVTPPVVIVITRVRLFKSEKTLSLPVWGKVIVLATGVIVLVWGSIGLGIGVGIGVATTALGVGLGLTAGESDCWYTTTPSPTPMITHPKTIHTNIDFRGAFTATSGLADII